MSYRAAVGLYFFKLNFQEASMSADDLKAKAIGALRRLQKLPGIVRGFLRNPSPGLHPRITPGKRYAKSTNSYFP